MFSLSLGNNHELRLLRLSDVDELFGLVDKNRSYLRTWLPWLDGTNVASDTQDFIKSTLQQLADNRGFVAAICVEKSIAGVIGYNHIDWQNRIGYIGYWLAEAYQGRGLMTTSCKAVIDYGFEILALNRIVINCASGNSRSRAVPERLGFTKELAVMQSGFTITLLIMKFMPNSMLIGMSATHNNPVARRPFRSC